MSGWISIGEPDVPRLSPDAEKVFSIIQYADKLSIGIVRMKTRFGDDRIIEAIYEIRKKEAIRMGKLTNQQRAAIYQAWKDGTTQKELAKQYGVCAQAISQLCAKLAKAEQEIMQPAAEDKPKPGIINQEFDAAVDAMIAESKSADKPEQLEDCENGIPNTPLVPAEIEKEISAIADEKSANAEPDKLPHYIWVALDDQVSAINWEIEQREQRIAELKEELVKLEDRRSAIESWVEEQKWQ